MNMEALDRGTKGWRMDHGRITLRDINKQVYMWRLSMGVRIT